MDYGFWIINCRHDFLSPRPPVLTVPQRPLRILSYNVHKGSSAYRRRNILAAIRGAIQEVNADIVLLQEVKVETRAAHGQKPPEAQFDYLARGIWPHVAYGCNVVRDESHHGNAILSRFPIVAHENIDISAHRVEGRGILHAVIAVPGNRGRPGREVHALCVHLGLFERWRKRQMAQLEARIRSAVPGRCPLIIGGDFNDWREKAAGRFAQDLKLVEAYHELHGVHARTFPSRLPTLRLDRVYVRGVEVLKAHRLDGKPWRTLSDHVPLLLEVL